MKKYATIEQHVFYYFNNSRGPHRKAIAIHTATEVHLHLKTLVSFNKNVFFEHKREVQTKKLYLK